MSATLNMPPRWGLGILKNVIGYKRVAPLALVCEFARRVAAVERLKTAHRASLAELDALFATLQHRAFRGELGVPPFGVPPSGGQAHERKRS